MNNFSLKAMPFDSEVITNPNTGQEEYDRVAHSKDLADLIRAYFSNGILVQGADLLTNELQVLHLSAMSCVVKPGGIIINGRTGFLENEQTIEFDVGTQYPRVDRVVAELNIAERNIYIKVLKGRAEVSPKPIGIMQTEDIYQIPLAQVRVNANQAVIASVTDERAGYISNVLLNQAPSEDITANTVGISEAVRNLYGLSTDNANVDDALKKTFPKTENILAFTYSQSWTPPDGVTLVDVYLLGGGSGGTSGGGHDRRYVGGNGGGGGYALYVTNVKVVPGTSIPIVIGAGGLGGTSTTYLNNGLNGGTTSFGNLSVVGAKGATNTTVGHGTSQGGMAKNNGQSSGSAYDKYGSGYCPINGINYAGGGGGGGAGSGSSSGKAGLGGKSGSNNGKAGQSNVINSNNGGSGESAAANSGAGGGAGGGGRYPSGGYAYGGAGGNGGSGIVVIRYYN